MYYCLIDYLALLVLLITNYDVLLKKTMAGERSSPKRYRLLLFAVIVYYIVDSFWAGLYELQRIDLLFLDTEVYFIVMATGIWLLSRYVVAYLGLDNASSRFFHYAGLVLLLAVIVATPLNRLWPCMFWFDEAGIYHAGIARDVIFVYQVMLLLLTSVYTMFFALHYDDNRKKRHYIISLSCFIMLVLVAVQIYFPTYPLYAIGYLLSCCLLRTFVVENEREEYRRNLEIALEREKEQLQELKKTWKLAYKDALTGVKSKMAYVEHEEQLDVQIAQGGGMKLAIVVFDLNNLKFVNDTFGHDVGDKYIKEACSLICGIFKKSPVYRIGGDEFVAVLQNEDFENRTALLAAFNQEIEKNRHNNGVVVAMGMAEYVPTEDDCCRKIFERADQRMYERKRQLKMST